MSRRGVIEIILYHISSLSYKTIHRQFKSTSVITIRSYLFGRLLDNSKQKTNKNKTIKIIENEFKQTNVKPYPLTVLRMTHCGLTSCHCV